MPGWILSPLGRALAAAGALLAAVAGIYAKGRRDAAREAERAALRRRLETQEKADEAAERYRADGAARRLRDGGF